MAGTKYVMQCMNAFVDGRIIDDFTDDQEAMAAAADYEAHLYKLTEDGRAQLIYWPGMDEEPAGETAKGGS